MCASFFQWNILSGLFSMLKYLYVDVGFNIFFTFLNRSKADSYSITWFKYVTVQILRRCLIICLDKLICDKSALTSLKRAQWHGELLYELKGCNMLHECVLFTAICAAISTTDSSISRVEVLEERIDRLESALKTCNTTGPGKRTSGW